MASLADNKALVRAYFDAFEASDFERVLSLLRDDFILCGMGKTEISHRWDKETVRGVFKSMSNSWASPFRMTIKTMTAEDDRVAVQAESQIKFKNGSDYSNNYHFLFTIENGKIKRIEEYCCTDHAIKVARAAHRVS